MADILESLLKVPQAVGGGALDILIGDRQNVPAGEQVKRSIEALLLAGDNPANLIAIHGMNAKRDAQNQAIVSSPDFQRSVQSNQATKNLSPMESFAYTAKQYGMSGYSPDTEQAAVDLAPGGPSAPERQTVPVLPPIAAGDATKYLENRTKLSAYTGADPLERDFALYEGARLTPPLDLQSARANRATEGLQIPGQQSRTISWNGKQYTVGIADIPHDQRVFVGADAQARAVEAAQAQTRINELAGVPLIAVPFGSDVTGYTIKQESNEAKKAAAGVIGKAVGEVTPLPEAGNRTPAELEQQKLVDKFEAQLIHQTKLKTMLASMPSEVARTAAVQTVKESDQLSGMIDQYLTALKPENIGAVGDLRQLKYGIASQQQGFANLQSGVMDSMAENNLRPGPGKGIEAVTGYFDPNLSTVQVLGNTIAYRIARILDPTGKLSDADVLNQKRALGLDKWFGSDQDIAGRMRVMQGFAQKQKGYAQSVLDQRPAGTTGAVPRATTAPSNTLTTKSGRTIVYQP